MSVEQTGAVEVLKTERVRPAVGMNKAVRSVIIGMVGIGVVAVAVGALARVWSGGEQADVKLFTVRPMTFPVVLKEKGEVKAKRSVDVKCMVDGQSTIISIIPEGTMVKEGDLLVELASQNIADKIRDQEIQVASLEASVEAAQREYEIQQDDNASQIRKAKLKVDLATLELEKYVKGDYPKDLREAQLAIETAVQTLRRKTDDYESSKKLAEQGYITRSALDDDKFEQYRAEVDLEKAKLSKDILEQYTHRAMLPQKESDVAEAEKELERTTKEADAQASKKKADLDSKRAQLEIVQDRLMELRDQQENCRIRAPGPGLVVYATASGRWDQTRIDEGVEVRERQTIIQLPDTSVMQVVVRINESKTDRIRMGQRAVVTVEGLPDQTFTGTVTKIAPLAESRNRWMNPDLKEYTTEITLDQTDPGLKPGATANAEILVEYLRDAIAVPVQAVYGYGGDQYVFRTDGGQVRPTKVQLGTSSTEYVQVLDGLQKDQQITMVVTAEMKQMLAKSGGKQEKQPGGSDLDSEDVSRLMAGATTQPAGAQDAKAGGVGSHPQSGNGSAERPAGRPPREGGRRSPRADGAAGGAGRIPPGG